jgi:GTP-binding protein EngB required for normal cell division
VEGEVTGVAERERLRAFDELVRLSAPRLDTEAFREAQALLDRVRERRRLSLDHTVVAFAGTTGSGKSSLFNAVCGIDLSLVSARRPTTAAPIACAWQAEGAAGLLDRLGVAERMRFVRPAADGGGADDADLSGLVLLDLPDHDSVVEHHRTQVDRLIGLVDVVVWVLDPEKYADASVHERYLRPLAGHADVMLVVLNQIDRLPEDAVPQCTEDLRRLLDEDGLAAGEHGEAGTQVLAASAVTGEGLPELRETLAQVVRERGAANRRIRADLDRAAAMLRAEYAGRAVARLGEAERERFLTLLGEAVGAGAVGKTAEREVLRRAARACAAPWGRALAERTALPAWVARGGVAGRGAAVRGAVRAGVARQGVTRVGVTRVGAARHGVAREGVARRAVMARPSAPAGALAAVVRLAVRAGVAGPGRSRRAGDGTAVSAANAVSAVRGVAAGTAVRGVAATAVGGGPADGPPGAQRALVDEAVCEVVEAAAAGLPEPWARGLRKEGERGGRELARVMGTGAGADAAGRPAYRGVAAPRPAWWTAVVAAQWVLLLAAVAGGVGGTARAAGSWVWPWWLSVALALGGPLVGAVLARLGVALTRPEARRHGHAVERRLREVAEEHGRALVLAPLDAELWRYREARERYAAVISPVRVAELSTIAG